MKFSVIKFLRKYLSKEKIRSSGKFLSYYLGGLFKSIENDHIFLSAAGIAFSLLLSIIPFLIIGFAIVGSFTTTESVMAQINQLILTTIPYPSVAAYVSNFIEIRLPDIYKYNNIAAYLGSISLFLTATWIFSSLRTALNQIYQIHSTSSMLKTILKDLLIIFSLIFILLLSTIVLPAVKIFIDEASNLHFIQFLGINDFLSHIISATSFILIFWLFFITYNIIPSKRIGKRVTALSAFWAAILWAGMKLIFGYYITHFLMKRNLYGAFLILMLVLFWIFYSSILFLIGAKIGILYKNKRDGNSFSLNK